MDTEYLLQTVVSDLQYLGDNWGAKVDDDTLRRGSSILRMLLVQGTLQRAWKAAGFPHEPRVIAPCLEPLLDSKNGKLIVHALAGGGHYEGVFAALAVIQRGQGPAVTPPAGSNPVEHTFRLREFVQSCGLFLQGHRIRRREIIKYVANKLGGAHLDFTRPATGAESTYIFLDRNANRFNVLGKNAIYFELLSIGQLVAHAPDIQQFIARVKSGGV